MSGLNTCRYRTLLRTLAFGRRRSHCLSVRPAGAGVLALLLFLAQTVAFGQTATTTYLEGEPDHRLPSGNTEILSFGDPVRPGESVVTGAYDLAELNQDGAIVRVQPDTVFTIRERERDGEKETVLTTTVGAVKYRFGRLTGREPRLGTAVTAAGVRGTELTVYAGSDGSALYVVDSGLVSVESAGEAVEISKDQGVEVAAGLPPGEPFDVIGRQLDFSSWNEGRLEAFLSDPLGALDRLEGQLTEFTDGLEEWYATYLASKAESDAAREELLAMEEGTERDTYRDEVWFPLANRTANSVLNYRYHALSALSLRRYVLTPLYIEMKTRNIVEISDEYRNFIEKYDMILKQFEERVTPVLEPWDI